MKDREVLIGLFGLWFLKRQRDKAQERRNAQERPPGKVSPSPQKQPAALAEPKQVTYAWLFRRPSDTFITLTVGPDPEHAVERGTFDDEQLARRVVKEHGYTLAWPDVRDLQ